jgi:serine/threonine protein kinase
MGTVYRARHRLMDRPVALKVIHARLVGQPGAVRHFRREIRAAARLAHPNIVAAYDADQAGDTHFFVMEYVEGTNLARLAEQEGRLPVALACDYVRQAALGLQHAFERGMTHGDVKPHNLMLTPAGVVKLLDMGLARFASEVAPPAAQAGPAATRTPPPGQGDDDPLGTAATQPAARRRAAGDATSLAPGTPDYMAPELVAGGPAGDIRADIYSLGCTLYRLLAGQVPFPGGTPAEKVRAHREQAPRPLAELRPEVPAGLEAVVARMLAKDPAQRYQTPGEAAQALAPFADPPARHVLVVDDNAAIRQVMATALTGQGYRVSAAANGREALDLLRGGPLPDLILLDLIMPVMDGWQFLHARRQDPRLAAVPVLIVSALDEGQAEAFALGVAGHLHKPIEPEKLWSAVRNQTDKT